MESSANVVARHEFARGDLPAGLDFLKRTRSELRMLRLVRVWPDRLQVIDINRDAFEIAGVGYGDAAIVPLLKAVNAAFDPQSIHEAPPGDNAEAYKEFGAGRRYTWALDRVM